MIKAKHMMKPIVLTFSLETTVHEAINLMKVQQQSSVAVISGLKNHHGIITEINLMRIFLRWQMQQDKKQLVHYLECLEHMQLVGENETFPDVVKKIVASPGNRIFVINRDFDLVGTIAARDILPVLVGTESGHDIMHDGTQAEAIAFEKEIETLRSELYLYENFFTYSPYMMHSSNTEGVIRMANDMLHAVLGYNKGELIGKTIFDIYPQENHEKAREGMKKIIKHGYHQMIHAQMVSKNKTVIDVEMASRQLSDQTGKPVGTITVSRPLKQKDLLGMIS